MSKLYDKLFYWAVYCSVVYNQMVEEAMENIEAHKKAQQ